MVITLYKDCIISKSYSEVFDVVPRTIGTTPNTSVFEQYLGTLSKRTIVTTNNYYKENSYIQLDVEQGNDYITDFNYMKIVVDNLIRYCFIDHVELCNAVAKVYYTEDVWHTYAKTMHIRNSLLVNSKTRKYGVKEIELYKLPMEYMTNEEVNTGIMVTSSTFNVILQIQIYELTSGATPEDDNRSTTTVLVNSNGYNLSLGTALSIVERLERYKPIGIVVDPLSGVHRKYTITNVTVVPSAFNIASSNLITKGNSGTISYPYGDSYNVICQIHAIYSSVNYNIIPLIENQTIANSFYNLSFGTFTSQYLLSNNGKEIKWGLYTRITSFDFKLLLSFQGKIFDITNDFVVKVPFSSIESDAFAQRQIATEQKISNANFEIASGAVRLGQGLISSGRKSLNIADNFLSSLNTLGTATLKTTDIIGATQNGGDIASGALGIARGIVDLEFAKRDKFNTSFGIYANSEGVINALYGLCKYNLIPSNTNQVTNLINNVGYSVYEIVDDIFNDVDDISEMDYDVIKFDFVNCYGKFNQGIENTLKGILKSGFKIWYTVNV